MFTLFTKLPSDLIKLIINLTSNSVSDLCTTCKYFNNHKFLRIKTINTNQAAKLGRQLKDYAYIISLNLYLNNVITDQDIKNFTNLTYLNLEYNSNIIVLCCAQRSF